MVSVRSESLADRFNAATIIRADYLFLSRSQSRLNSNVLTYEVLTSDRKSRRRHQAKNRTTRSVAGQIPREHAGRGGIGMRIVRRGAWVSEGRRVGPTEGDEERGMATVAGSRIGQNPGALVLF